MTRKSATLNDPKRSLRTLLY